MEYKENDPELLEQLATGDTLSVSDTIIVEEDQINLLSLEADVYGPYESHLYTEGMEFWMEDINVWDTNDEITYTTLNNKNHYVGWYHIRNSGTQYQVIVPTKTKEEEYTGAPLHTLQGWFAKFGLSDIVSQLDGPQIKGCTNPEAWNYNPLATVDDDSCWIVPGYFLGQIPPQTMNNLHTTGGELISTVTNLEYQGYYHVHGPGDLPLLPSGESVVAGTIMTGREYDGTNITLVPANIENRFMAYNSGEDVTENEGGTFVFWNDIIVASSLDYVPIESEVNNRSVENYTAIVDTTSEGQNRDFLAFDNIVSTAESVAIMNNADYQFNHLLQDTTKAPGIYGMVPKITSDLNSIEFSNEHGEAPGGSYRDQLGQYMQAAMTNDERGA